MKFKRYPLFRIFLAFSGGILWASFLEVSFGFSIFFFIASLCAVLLLFFIPSSRAPHKSTVFGLSSWLMFVALGLVLSHWQSDQHIECHYRKQPAADLYRLQIMEQPVSKESSLKTMARVLCSKLNDSVFTSAGKVLLYIEKDSLSASLDYGDEIVYTGRLNELDGPQNPHEFDYRNYLNLKAVYAQAYVPASAWQLFKRREGFSLKGWSSEVRKYLLGVIGQWPLSEKEGSVTKALLLGYRYDIDDRLLRAYSSAGATHVLAVSGLHVGIVYMITYYLLFFLGKVKYGPFIRSVILVILLWAYALITGLSPSVVRAATMFSFVAVGTAFKRPTSIYNTLLASAMVLLVIKPTYLFEVGFQLSYMAVLGIVWLQPRFESLLKPQNWVLKQIWTITTVSLAAQIATFPLGLYYFHQFPALFLISNLLVIPLVTVLMYVGLVALVLSASGWMFKPLIAVYDWLLQLMNSSVEWVEGLVIFLIDQIHISRFELVLLYLFIGFGFAWLFKGGVWRLQIAKGIAVLLLVFQLIENYHLQEHPQLTVYAMRDHEAMSFMSGGKGVLVADSALLADEDAMTFHVRHHLWANNTTQVDYLRWNDDLESGFFRKKGDWLCFNNELIWYCRSDYAHGPPAATWLVGKQSGSPSPEWSPPKRIIIHKEVWPSLSREWKQWAAEKQVKVEDLGEGCFQARF